MNKRIQKLAEQVGSTHKQNLGVYQFYSNELEDFVKLIVFEVLSNIEDQRFTVPDFIITGVQKHFGVEE